MKKLGIIGGLGPMATAFFMQMVIEMTEAEVDQNHIEMLIHNCPSIPDRTSYILDNSKKNPAIPMSKIGQGLVLNGAEIIAIPCITANYFLQTLSKSVKAPIINTIFETTKYLKERGIKKIGLMATDGTVKSQIFQSELEKEEITFVIPEALEQRYVMDIIYNDVKATKPVDMNKFMDISKNLWNQGAEVIVLGCTELSIIRRDECIGAGYLDAMQVLAKCSVEQCGNLKENYYELITK
jgi:aspartate racemase